VSLEYPRCLICLGDGVMDDGITCNKCQGFGDMRTNVIPELTEVDYELLDGSERSAMLEVFNVNNGEV